jgi:type II secretory pathway component PulF
VTPALEQLRASLTRLHGDGSRAGLPAPAATRLVEALDRGVPIGEAAAGSGLDRRVARAAALSDSPDLPGVLTGLTRTAAELSASTRQLRAAGSYPLVLAVSVVLGGLVLVGAALPALEMMPVEGGLELWPPAVLSAGAAALLLVALGAVVLSRVRLPWLSTGWIELERYAFLASLHVLIRSGAPLPSAVRGAAAWTGRRARAAAVTMARSLEAGAPVERLPPLLLPHEATMLAGAATAGTVPEAVEALALVRRVALTRAIPDAIVRVQAAAIVLAGSAVLCLGYTFFQAYSRVGLG